MPEAAGVWHSVVYGAMLDTQAVEGFTNPDAMKTGRTRV